MSLAIFGRFDNVLVGGLVWFALLVASLSVENPEILFAALIVNSVVERDMELPCRDETEGLDLSDSLVAVCVWAVALLALCPMS